MEVHIANIHARDTIYHNSQVSKVVTAVFAGLASTNTNTRLRPCAAISTESVFGAEAEEGPWPCK
jgi:3-dehydroquinate dehydratase